MTDRQFFPDGAEINEWFFDRSVPSDKKQYIITDYGIKDDGKVYTKEFQALIDLIARNGGGDLTVPAGAYISGAIHFKQGVNLTVLEGGMLKGSDDMSDYPVCMTRIEGQSCLYFPALINADGLDGFTIKGPGIIDGNGLRSWKAFWLRRTWNPDCTNKDEQRARLIFMQNCSNVTVANIRLQNSQFWTNHLYRCHHVKYLNCDIFSPKEPVAGPSTDAIDLDVCSDVLVANCRMEVNDDAVVLKGGKGPWADEAPENGMNERIIVEDCEYGFCHGCLTCGSESIHNRNVIMRRIHVSEGLNLIWLKMRPDTPQLYEYITASEITGNIDTFVNVTPWRQFFDLKGRTDMPVSKAENVSILNCECNCKTAFMVELNEEQYHLKNFKLHNLTITAQEPGLDMEKTDSADIKDIIWN